MLQNWSLMRHKYLLHVGAEYMKLIRLSQEQWMWSLYSWASLMQLRNEVLKIQVWTELQLRSTRPTGRRSVSIGPSISTYRALHWHPRDQWPVSRKSWKLFGPEKPFLKLRLAHSVKLVFSYVVKGRKIKVTAKFGAQRRLRFENTKITLSSEMRPKSFGTFEKRASDSNPVQVLIFKAFISLLRWSRHHSGVHTLTSYILH